VIRPALALLIALTGAPTEAQPAPGNEPLRRIDEAVGVLEGRGFAGSFTMTVRVSVAEPGGGRPQVTEEEHRVTIAPDGARATRLVRAVEDGRDVTARRQKRSGGEQGGKVRGEEDVDFKLLPIGANAQRHAFAAVRREGNTLVAAFRPAARDGGRDTLSKGELAWNEVSGDPLWIELQPADDPRFVDELRLRFEFGRAGDVLFPSRVFSRTRAGIPLLFRVLVEVDIAVSDVARTR
jgi:hypothetical protein